jgi:hypothetical protein
LANPLNLMARPAGFEPATYGFVVRQYTAIVLSLYNMMLYKVLGSNGIILMKWQGKAVYKTSPTPAAAEPCITGIGITTNVTAYCCITIIDIITIINV